MDYVAYRYQREIHMSYLLLSNAHENHPRQSPHYDTRYHLAFAYQVHNASVQADVHMENQNESLVQSHVHPHPFCLTHGLQLVDWPSYLMLLLIRFELSVPLAAVETR